MRNADFPGDRLTCRLETCNQNAIQRLTLLVRKPIKQVLQQELAQKAALDLMPLSMKLKRLPLHSISQ